MMNFSDRLTIGGKSLGLSEKPFVVAEVSANHNNDLQRAREIVLAAAANGADAVKFQTYTADTITLDSSGPDFLIHDGLWKGQRLYDLYSKGSLPWDWHQPLFELARSLGLAVISTPFDESAVDFLVGLGVDALKIASFELTHIPLIRKVAGAGLPVIISTGMGTAAEIEEAVSAVDGISKDLILLHCVSSYPAEPKDYSLKNLVNLRERHGCLVGLSDHCVENRAAAASVLYDSVFIEKHFTLDRLGGGLDDSFSLEPSGLAELRAAVDEMFYAARHVSEVGESEKDNVSLRRSIYVSKPVRSGEVLTAENIRVVRPGFGMHPRHYDEVIGRRAVNDLEFASPLNRGDVDWSS